jgi:hypothetical protein
VQQVLQGRGVVLGEEGAGGARPRGPGREAGEATGVEGPEGVEGGALGAAEVAGDAGGVLALVAGEQDLAAAQGEGVGGVQAGAQLGALGLRKRADKEWWMHNPLFGLQHSRTRALLPLH